MSASWPIVTLGEVMALDLDRVPVNPSTTFPMVGVLSFGRGLFDREPIENGATSYKQFYRLKAEHVVMSQLFGWEGALALSNERFAGKFLSPQFPTFLVDPTRLDRQFLGWLMKRPAFWSDLGSRASGMGDRRRTLNPEALLVSQISLPPLDEQRRIVARIEELATKVGEAERLRRETANQLNSLQASASAKIFSQLLKGHTQPLAECVRLERGKFSHRPRNDPRFFGGDHPWIQIAEIEAANKYINHWNATLNDDGLSISRKFPRGTVLISIAATIGAVGILGFDCCIPDSIVAVTPPPTISSEFVYHYLSFLRTHLEAVAPQSAQKNINLEILGSLPFPSLTHDVQTRIVSELNALKAQIDAVESLQTQTTAELDAMMPAILDKAFRGEI